MQLHRTEGPGAMPNEPLQAGDSMTAPAPRIRAPSPREARIAGLCYLAVIAGGVFAALFVRDRLIVGGDAAATAAAIAAHEALWRWGIAVHLLYLLPGAAFGVILYRLFRPVQATLALLALVLLACDVGLEALQDRKSTRLNSSHGYISYAVF